MILTRLVLFEYLVYMNPHTKLSLEMKSMHCGCRMAIIIKIAIIFLVIIIISHQLNNQIWLIKIGHSLGSIIGTCLLECRLGKYLILCDVVLWPISQVSKDAQLH